MEAVILVAGMGNRLKSVVSGSPKCMTTVGGKSIAERQIDNLMAAGVKDILCVTGYQEETLRSFLSSRYPFLRYVHNERFAETNTIYSLYLAFPEIKDDFFYLNGDVVFAPSLLVKLLAFPGTGLAVEFKKCGEEEVKVALTGSRVTSISKKVPLDQAKGEFTGIALFRRNMHAAFYRSLKNEIEGKKNVKDYFERALDAIVDRVDLQALDITGEPFVEIDFPEDLERARKLFP
jgi:L-glutamine-phosphate cytidylyltransferase